MEELKNGYFVSKACKICTSKDKAGNPLRDLIDHTKDEGTSTRIIRNQFNKDSIDASHSTYDFHFRRHSPWLIRKERAFRDAKINNALSRAVVEHRNAEDELQKLVDVGGERIDNGEIKVDKDLYMFGLDRMTKFSSPVSIENLIMNFGNALAASKRPKIIDGEVK